MGGSNAASATKPRVLVLIKGLGLGGAERLVVDVVTHADHERFEYEVAFVLSAQDALAPALRHSGVPVRCLGARSSTDLRWLTRLRRLLAAGHFDVLHSHLPYTAALGRMVALSMAPKRRPVLVYTEHSLWDRAAVVTKALNRATVGLDSALFVVSSASRDALPRRLRARAQVVMHGVDRTRSAKLLADQEALRLEVRSELGIADDRLLVLTVANLRPEKGYDVLLEAATTVKAEGLPVYFVSVGWGPLESDLAARRDAAGLRDDLEFLGRRSDALRLMAAADLFVLPSHQEGLPVALMEALSMGLPVVVTDVGGVGDLVSPDVEGLMVPPGRPDLLAEAIVRMGRDATLRASMGEWALAGSARLDVDVASRTIEAVYSRLTENRTP